MHRKPLFFLLFLIVSVSCHFISHDTETRAKRSPEEGFFAKVKTGLSQFGSDVKKVGVKGYEEVKNLFSKDRKVGDYTLDKLDVRFGEDEEEELEETTTDSADVDTETKLNEIVREKRDLVDLERELKEGGDIKTATEASSLKSTTLPNNAELSPGYPPPMEIILKPLTCKQGHASEDEKC